MKLCLLLLHSTVSSGSIFVSKLTDTLNLLLEIHPIILGQMSSGLSIKSNCGTSFIENKYPLFFPRGFSPHFTWWEDAKNKQQFDSFFSCISVYAHLPPNAEGPFPILTFLWQITTATFANHYSTFVNFNSSSQDLCEEVSFPLYGWGTKTSRT